MRKIKDETIHTLARIGRKYRLLRYPILAVLVVFVFIYNLDVRVKSPIVP